MRVCGTALITAVLVSLGLSALEAAETPRRVVSFNLCADQLVVALADPEQIAGLSPYGADPRLSVVADKARAFPRLEWQAESTLVIAPDLVFVSSADRPATRKMLAAQGVRMVELPLVSDLKSARAEIAQVAALLGHPERGRTLIAALDAAQARLAQLRPSVQTTALIIERNGFASGADSLAAMLAAEAGYRPPADAPKGLGGYVKLERLLVMRPDVLIFKDLPTTPEDQGALFLTHPALQALYPPERRIVLPTRFSLCGGPALVAALDYLADVLQGVRKP